MGKRLGIWKDAPMELESLMKKVSTWNKRAPCSLRKPLQKMKMATSESSEKQVARRVIHREGASNRRQEPKNSKGPRKKGIYIGNLPSEIAEEQIQKLFAAFEPVTVRKIVSGLKCYAFVDVGDAENVALAISHLNNTIYNGRRLVVRELCESRGSERLTETTEVELPPLEKVDKDLSLGNKTLCISRTVKDGSQINYAIPLEMRSLTLVQMLTSCFKDIGWMTESIKVHGDVGLMVMDTFPHMPYFWAMNLTPETYVKMCQLFNTLSVVTLEKPFLKEEEVRRGQRCVAEFPGEGGEWNRCWIVDVVESRVILFYVDSGSTACVPASSVKSLDSDEFWTIPPLVQPFVLQQGVMGNRKMDGIILKGRIVGFHEAEPHILRFSITDED
ncbi:tudor domain-containing protein 10-like isoform X2 [Chiloscyllium plagiosum]|uniref:tudor domain-containing protein 10-like isoform X2 n=1 Tax=Chiloscyllium plagiosum TaxID=36176 RepID=UPI001CB7C7E6|nr:tudor domain-containing protein 10-like isoform X2 [Chiloscyllium plagiosum]